jgi:Cys-tRNA(Pro)/Cys-tRNA(Cys) deacylase
LSRPKVIAKTNAARILDDLGVTYTMVTCQVTENDLSAETAAQELNLPLEMVYKTLLLKGHPHGHLEACLPAGTELDLKALAKASANRSMALVPLKDLFALTGYQRGGCSPLGSRRSYPVFVHQEVTKLEKLAINAGARGHMLLLRPDDFIKATKATLAMIARPKA